MADVDEPSASFDKEVEKLRLATKALATINASGHALTPAEAEAVDQGFLAAGERIAKAAKGGGKLSRSETVTVRLDPKLRYLAELAARLHRRTLSSYVEWSIEASLSNNVLTTDPHGPSIKDEAENLWDVDEADRFAKLALRYPHLLTHEEQVLWKFIREAYPLWGDGSPFNLPGEAELSLGRLRRNWDFIKQSIDQGKTAGAVVLFMKD